MDSHIPPTRHNMMIPDQPVFALTTKLNREAANTKFIVYGFAQLKLELTIYHIRYEQANKYILIWLIGEGRESLQH